MTQGRDSGPVGPRAVAGFVAACRALGADARDPDLRDAAAGLLARWGAPSRGYHDVEHLGEVLAHLGVLPGGDDPAVVLAAWFHDAVYDGVPGRDEQRSADLAAGTLARLGVGAGRDRVAGLVLVTADHRPPPGDDAAAALCDADLAVLAAPAARYDRYVAGVRAEYAHVDDDAFRAGRAAVLRDLAERPVLFVTAQGRARWDAAARANLRRELLALTSPAGPSH